MSNLTALERVVICTKSIRGFCFFSFTLNGERFDHILFASRESLCDCLEALWNG